MFDFEEFYKKMADRIPDGGVVAEVGVGDGASLIYLAETLADMGKRVKIYAIDSLDYGKDRQLATIIGHVVNSGMASVVEIMPTDSLNASCRFHDRHFDFVYIDASHRYEETKADIRLWHRKVKEGGILAGHDYLGNDEVKRAVDEVIPKAIRRPSPGDTPYKAEKACHQEDTSSGYGVWWVELKPHLTIY